MFKLPEEIKRGIEDYRNSLQELLDGKLADARFRGIRVPWGFYSHRGGKVFMARIRIPAGVTTSAQLKALASASQKYGIGLLHITTRQDIQIHYVKIENTIKIMEFLRDYDLCPRGGGGNTLRNIIGCPFSDICKDGIFDIRGHAAALSEYLLRQETSYNLPRKFKISFSGCSKDCCGAQVNDVGFFAMIKNGKKGFKVYVGGGMGADSRVGKLLEEFIPEQEIGYCAAAVRNAYYKKGDRKNKHHNRLRFLIDDDIGIEEFKKCYRQELEELKKKEQIELRKVDFAIRQESSGKIPRKNDKEYREFLKYNVRQQKQKGFSIIELRIPRGDINHDKLIELADLETDFPGIEFRTTQNQNLSACWVKNEEIYNIYLRVKEILDEVLYPNTLLDVVACKGALTCNLGLCNSPGLAKEIESAIKKDLIGKKVFELLEIKVNGCQNSCGQHPIGKLSFHGLVRRADNLPVPFYNFLIGGRKEEGKAKLAQVVGPIPAKNIPKFLTRFLNEAEKAIGQYKDVYDFIDGKGRELALEILSQYNYVPSIEENRDFYIDWGRTDEFSLAGLGPGECSAGVIDMIDADLAEAKIALEEAEKSFSTQELQKILFFSARALLIVKGSDPKTPHDAFSDFASKFIGEGIASGKYSDIEIAYNSLNSELSREDKKQKLDYAKEFNEHINSIYKNMEPSFTFQKIREEQAKTEEKSSASYFLDLKGTPCPLNYVKTKLFLEGIKSGDILDVLLDEGAPIENVPRSLQNDGHAILKIEKIENYYKLTVKKK